MKIIYRTLLGLHIFVGLGAMAGGLAAILDPYTPMGITVDALVYSPFTSFLIPGIFLFGFLGLGNIFAAVMFRFKLKYQGYISGVMGAALALWIVIQCIMLWAVVALHVIFFILGAVQGLLSLAILYDRDAFPFNVIKRYLSGKQS